VKVAFVMQPINLISLADQSGSIEIITYELARRLARNCDVIVYAKKGRYQKEFEYDQGVQYRRISVPMDEWHTFVSSGLSRLERYSGMYALSRGIRHFFFFRNVSRPFFASRWFYRNYALQVAKSLRKEDCGIVHVHNFSQLVPVIRAFNPKIKIVLHMHCEWLTQLDRAMIKSRLGQVDLIIGVSNFITKKIQCCFPEFARRCRTLLNGAGIQTHCRLRDHGGEREKNEVTKLLTVGRVSPEKGIHVLLDAFKDVLEHCPQAQLEIMGWIGTLPVEYLIALSDDQLTLGLTKFYRGEQYLSHLQSKLSLSQKSHVSFLREVPHKLIPNYYRDAAVYVSASVCNEPGNMPVIEAMAAGVPVVATRGGGTIESVVDGETGLLVERGDASALADAIIHLLSDERLRKTMGKAAYRRAVERFSWEHVAKNLLQLYEEIGEVSGKSS
jgi:glycosyltransferase involved in cell wall biosynthesis